MNPRTLLAWGGLAAVLVVLLAALVLGDDALVLWAAIAVGVAAIGAGAYALYAGARRGYLLGRYLLTRPIGVEDATDLGAGTGWLRVTGDVAAPTDVASVTGGDVAGRVLRLERRTHPFDMPWPGVDRRPIGTETDVGRLAIVGERDRVRFEGDASLVAPATRERYGPGHEPSYELLQALQRHDRTFEDVVGDGSHRLHLLEAVIEPGDAVELFGLLTVGGDGVTTLRPAEGTGGTVAVGRGRRLPLRYLRGTVAGLAGSAVLLSLGWFLLSLALA